MLREAPIIASALLIAIIAIAFLSAAAQKPEFREVLFFEQLWGSSSPGTGMAEALPWTAVGVASPDSDTQPYFKPLSGSFVLSREWSGSSYDDQGESLWTFLKSGEVIRFGFNSSEPVYMDLVSDQSGVLMLYVNSTYSYSGTFRVAKGGLYLFDFSIGDSVHRSVNATVSFRCLEAVKRLVIDSH